MNYCILRAAKLTSLGSIMGSAKHTFREIPTPNANPARTHLNKSFGAQNATEVYSSIKEILPAKRRKDAVLCIEYLVTASPEWFRNASSREKNDYFKAAMRWLEERHGKANVVCINVQLDETTPHLAVYVVPMTKDGRLAAKDFLGGRKILTEMQTDFAEKVGIPAGLERGIEGSKAEHTTNAAYNASLQKNPTLIRPETPAPSFTDRLNGNAKVIAAAHEKALAEHDNLIQQAKNVAEFSQRSRVRQALALEKLRKDAIEAKKHEFEARSLREENKLLRQEIEEQRTYFQQQIFHLRSALDRALGQIKLYLAKIGLLTGQPELSEVTAGSLNAMTFQTYGKSNIDAIIKR